MSSFTFADHKLGGRLQAACDAIGLGHFRRAAGIFAEIAGDLNAEAEAATGLMADEGAALVAEPDKVQASVVDLKSCSRGAHSFGPVDPETGWRTCMSCQMVNVTPPSDGPIDMGAMR